MIESISIDGQQLPGAAEAAWGSQSLQVHR